MCCNNIAFTIRLLCKGYYVKKFSKGFHFLGIIDVAKRRKFFGKKRSQERNKL